MSLPCEQQRQRAEGKQRASATRVHRARSVDSGVSLVSARRLPFPFSAAVALAFGGIAAEQAAFSGVTYSRSKRRVK